MDNRFLYKEVSKISPGQWNSGLFLICMMPFMVNGVVNYYIAGNALYYWLFELISWLAIPALCLFLYLKHPLNSLTRLGFQRRLLSEDSVFITVAIGFLLFPLVWLVYRITLAWFTGILSDAALFSYGSMIPEQQVLKWLVVVYFALTAGFVEEALYRGLLYQVFSKPVYYVAGSSMLFGIVHWESGLANVFAATVLGVFMALVYLKIKNIWPLIIAHCLTNMLVFW